MAFKFFLIWLGDIYTMPIQLVATATLIREGHVRLKLQTKIIALDGKNIKALTR